MMDQRAGSLSQPYEDPAEQALSASQDMSPRQTPNLCVQESPSSQPPEL